MMFLYIERKMKHAFTMIELVFVIVVIGIVSAVVLPRMDRDVIGEAATQLASHIRYTQHLALVDDKFTPNQQFWYRERWQMECTANICTIYSDLNRDGEIDENEIAVDPLDGNKRMTGDSTVVTTANLQADDAMNYNTKYNAEFNATVASSCGNFISFDHLGRPYTGDPLNFNRSTDGILTANCVITLVEGDNNATITIRPETGYTSIQIN